MEMNKIHKFKFISRAMCALGRHDFEIQNVSAFKGVTLHCTACDLVKFEAAVSDNSKVTSSPFVRGAIKAMQNVKARDTVKPDRAGAIELPFDGE
mgnify:CR=1 FL=1